VSRTLLRIDYVARRVLGQAADTLAGKLVENKLAACVNVIPGVKSTYMWEGKINNDFVLPRPAHASLPPPYIFLPVAPCPFLPHAAFHSPFSSPRCVCVGAVGWVE